MSTHKKRILACLIVLTSIGICAFAVFIFGNYSIVHEREPAWSPNGKYIAFACEPSIKLDERPVGFDDLTYYLDVNGICIKELDSGKTTWITRTLERRAPFWSPDSQKIAWLNVHEPYQLTVWDRVSGKYIQYPLEDRCIYDCMPVWSLDGSRIFFQGDNTWLDLNSGKQFRLDGAGTTVFSPTGRYAAYAAGGGASELNQRMIIFDLEANRIVFKTDIANVDLDYLNWNSDGSILSWVAVPERGNVQLGLTNISTGESSFLRINGIGLPKQSAWSPKGNKFILQTVGEDEDYLVVIQIKCQEAPFSCEIIAQKPYSMRGLGHFGWYTWSVDGKRIAYETDDQYGHIWILDLETSRDYPLITGNK